MSDLTPLFGYKFKCSILPIIDVLFNPLVCLNSWRFICLICLFYCLSGRAAESFAAPSFPAMSLYTGGNIMKQSSLVFINPSKLSCLCYENFTFVPIYLQSNNSGGSDIIILMAISPHLSIKSIIYWFNYSLSLSAMARTPYICCMRSLATVLLNTYW